MRRRNLGEKAKIIDEIIINQLTTSKNLERERRWGEGEGKVCNSTEELGIWGVFDHFTPVKGQKEKKKPKRLRWKILNNEKHLEYSWAIKVVSPT